MNTHIRHLNSLEDYQACVDLQKETWGQAFNGCVPLSILMVSQRVGGISAGAFDDTGKMLGCVYGLTGLRNGKPTHWSDILAVTPEARGTGLGKQLKLFQRAELLKIGVETMLWTYDPLQALNANLNINGLGALPVEYVENMYGDTGSELHTGLGTDRFVVQWNMNSELVERTLAGASREPDPDWEDAPIANTDQSAGELFNQNPVRVEIPSSINDLEESTPGAGAQWRASTREAFTYYLAKGYTVTSYYRSNAQRCFYVLHQNKETNA